LRWFTEEWCWTILAYSTQITNCYSAIKEDKLLQADLAHTYVLLNQLVRSPEQKVVTNGCRPTRIEISRHRNLEAAEIRKGGGIACYTISFEECALTPLDIRVLRGAGWVTLF
jgi:hypothetical protein